MNDDRDALWWKLDQRDAFWDGFLRGIVVGAGSTIIIMLFLGAIQ